MRMSKLAVIALTTFALLLAAACDNERTASPAPGGTEQPISTPALGGAEQPISTPALGGTEQPISTPALGGTEQPISTPALGGTEQPISTPAPGGAEQPISTPAPGGAEQLISTPALGGTEQPISTPALGGTEQPISTPAPGGAEQPISTPAPGGAKYLTTDIPPCTPLPGLDIDPCEPDASVYWGQAGGLGSRGPLGDSPLPVSYFFGGSITYRPSIVLRGTFLPDTVRCITGIPNRVPSYVEPGSWFEDSLLIECYADIQVNSYIVGSGPTTLTLQVFYLHYFEGEFEDLLAEGSTAEEGLFMMRTLFEHSLMSGSSPGQTGLYGHEAILFIGPSHNHETEKWEIFGVWELERRDEQTVIAVHPNRDLWKHDPTEFETHRSKLEMTLAEFATAATSAHQALVTANGGRIAPADIDGRKAGVDLPMMETDANRLTQFYTSAGAYQHPDGPPTTPEPAYNCAGGSAVSAGRENVMLTQHCEALLDGKDTLRGAASLNWSKTLEISAWDGITTATVGDTVLRRVTKLELPNKSLNGSIPAEFGNLLWLTHLDLSGNSLTGEIPAGLRDLTRLEVLKLSGNSFAGCIPVAWKDVPTNDLASLNIPYCQPPPPDNASAGTPTESGVPISWNAAPNVTKYRVDYLDVSVYPYAPVTHNDDITGTSHTVDGLKCDSEYWFAVFAYGDGGTYNAAWSDASNTLQGITTAPCMPPAFAATSYSFSVVAGAAVDSAVGTVSASGSAGADDAVIYAITAGNENGLFNIDGETGAVTVDGDLSGEAGSLFTLSVEATDESGGSETVTVTVEVIESCDSGTAVPNPASNAGLVSDCNTLLGLKSALTGTAALNWSADLAMTAWNGITVGGTPRRVTELELERKGLTGVIPPTLGDLTELETLDLSLNALTGEIPAELASLSQLEDLSLWQNNLTGDIPSELGGLTNVYDLWLQDNDLTGPIPPELGSMTQLWRLSLADNDLSGTIPAGLTGLTSLTLLLLYGNNLAGCVPPSLYDVDLHDLDALGLLDCQEGPAAPTGLSASLTGVDFAATWTAISGVDEYEVQWRIEGSDNSWEALSAVQSASVTYTPTGGPQCSSTYEFRVRAHGDGFTYATHWGPESVAESVDTASCPPEFVQDPYAFEIAEDAAVDDPVGMVSATDPDQDDLTYSITTGNTGNAFAVDNETGAITVAAALDQETTEEYTLTVEVSDGKGGTATATATVTITDVAEDAPPAPSGLTVSLTEGTFAITWTALDGAAKYEAQHKTDAADSQWTALPETAALGATYAPAGGTACSTEYQFRVRAYGDGDIYIEMWGVESDAELMETATCLPEFDRDPYAFEIAEDAAVDDPVGTVSATDPDRDALTYSITTGNTGNAFAIDGESGAITVTAALDHETTEEYALTVEVSDGQGGTGTATVTVTVTDVAEDAPLAPSGLTVSLTEGTFAITWTALDGAAKYEAQHKTADGDSQWTALPETTGLSTTYAPEGGAACSTEYHFRVRAYGDGDIYTEMWGVESDVKSVETATCPPEFDQVTYAFEVEEEAMVGDLVGMVSATDPDQDDVTYSITAGNTGGAFAIEGESGAITVAAALNHEDIDQYTLMVEASDGAGGEETATVTITVTDVAEDAPPAPAGLSVTLADGTFSISWTALDGAAKYEAQHKTADADSQWTALPETADVRTTYAPEGGATCSTEHQFRVRAYGDGDIYTEMWGVESAVESVETATCSPEFDQVTYYFEVEEEVVVGDLVGMVSATDPDQDDVTYSISAGNTGNVFAIDGESGAITVAGSLDYETTEGYTLTVEASDGKGGADTATVTITVTDVIWEGELELWSGTMTAGAFTFGFVSAYGYTTGMMIRDTHTGGPHGTLDNATFTYSGETYTVELATYVAAIPDRHLFFLGLEERRLPADTEIALYVNGHRLDGWITTGLDDDIDTNYYYVAGIDFTLSEGQEVALTLKKTNP